MSDYDNSNIRLTKNLVKDDWSKGIGPSQEYSYNGVVHRSYGVQGLNHKNESTVLWECRPDGSGGADGGWNTHYFDIDPNKTYRFSVFIKRNHAISGGHSYLGCGNNNGVCHLNTTTVKNNPYFWNGALPYDGKWYLIVGYVYPAGSVGCNHDSSGVYDTTTGEKIKNGISYCWSASTTRSYHRVYTYYNNTTLAKQWMWDARVELVEGYTDSISNLIGNQGLLPSGVADAINNNTTTINGSKITTGSIHTNQLAANSITASKIHSNAITADKISIGTLSELASGAGTIVSGKLRNSNNTNFINLDAVGTQSFIKVGSKVNIQANGDVFFDGVVISRNLIAESGSFTLKVSGRSDTGTDLPYTKTIPLNIVGTGTPPSDTTYSGEGNAVYTHTSYHGAGIAIGESWGELRVTVTPHYRTDAVKTANGVFNTQWRLHLYIRIEGPSREVGVIGANDHIKYDWANTQVHWAVMKVT